MQNSDKRQQVLVCWVGQTDLNASQGKTSPGLGPIASVLGSRSFDEIELLSNYDKAQTEGYVSWLKRQIATPVQLYLAQLSSPMHFGEIYKVVVSRIESILARHGPATQLTYHLSPGTSAMAAVWIIVSKTRFAAELIESSQVGGIKQTVVPFDISAEFLPDMLRRPDADVVRLGAGRPDEAVAFEQIIHRSPAMQRVVARAVKVAPRSLPVLIEGESGTGKELFARAIHQHSPRREKPFIAVNCGAIPQGLMESEFFGHKKGAFSGAGADRMGHFEEADGGTLFLDEIGELPLEMQVKLLRALQQHEVTPVGSSKVVRFDVRVIAATNRRLAEEVEAGQFREDLLYRIAVAVIRLPPLREREGDLGLLITHLLQKINEESRAEPNWEEKKLTPGARKILLQQPWRGNVRELQNTLTRAVIWSLGKRIEEDDIREALFDSPSQTSAVSPIIDLNLTSAIDLQAQLADTANHYLKEAFRVCGGNRSKAAKLLGFNSPQTFTNWMVKYTDT